MPDIVLATLNARYSHCAFGLRCLLANLGPLRRRAAIAEFEVSQRPIDVAEAILRESPRIVGLGVYIWNAGQSLELVAVLKRIRPDLVVVLGGPEVSHETAEQEIVGLADYVIRGEGDLAFARLCEGVLGGGGPTEKIIRAPPPEMHELALPYDHYSDHDLRHRTVYVEASRGCPFSCEFCLSSLDIPVRAAALDRFLPAMQRLLDRGLLHFKFVDRTFNLNIQTSRAILEFFLERHRPGMFLHFEMVPDRLPAELREVIARFPPGTLQFEVGVQTFNADVAALISRRQDPRKTQENLRWLRERTNVYVHADLIIGLPGESVESFAAGFDRLVALGPHEIQLELLKRLRGTPIVRHDAEWGVVYSPHPPYEALQTRLIDFAAMQRLRRFARYWDMIGNSGNFVRTLSMIRPDARDAEASAFRGFMDLSDWLFKRTGQTHGIALGRLMELVFAYLTTRRGREAAPVAEALIEDYRRGGRADVPEFLRSYVPADIGAARRTPRRSLVPPRQRRGMR